MAWKAAKDPKGRTYYYDTVTRATSWTLPTGETLIPSTSVSSPSATSSKTTRQRGGDTTTTTTTTAKATVNNNGQEEQKKEKGNADQIGKSQTVDGTNELLSESQAKERFVAMLKDHGVDIQWSFERVMDELSSNDKRYWFTDGSGTNINSQWDDPLWKQSIWKDYVWDQQSQRLEDHISSFKSLLKQKYDDGMLKIWHPWPFARKHVLNMDTDYSFVILNDDLQRKIYYDFIKNLRKLKDIETTTLINQAKDEMRLYLKSIMYQSDIESNSNSNSNSNTISKPLSWDHLVSKYLSVDNKRFVANKNFQLLTMEDNLVIYMDLLKQYETELTKKLADLEELNYTRDRFARDQFKSLLDGKDYIENPHYDNNNSSSSSNDQKNRCFVRIKIKFNSDWNKDIYPQIKSDPRFLNLVGRNGSSPLDLFYDKINELRTILKTKSSLVEDILIERGIDSSQINSKQLKKILLEERQKLNLNDKSSDDNNNSNNNTDDDIDELVEFIYWQRHLKDLQTFEELLIDLLRTQDYRQIPSWETIRPELQQISKDQFLSLTEEEMYKSYSMLVQHLKQQQEQRQNQYRYQGNLNPSKKRTLEQIELDY